jgi:hypothetical protein
VVTTLRSSVRMYVFFVYNNFFLIACFINSSPEVTFQIALVNCEFWTKYVCHLDWYRLGFKYLISDSPGRKSSVKRKKGVDFGEGNIRQLIYGKRSKGKTVMAIILQTWIPHIIKLLLQSLELRYSCVSCCKIVLGYWTLFAQSESKHLDNPSFKIISNS